MVMSQTEQWKDIAGYKGRYQISNYGLIRSLPRPWRRSLIILKNGKDTDGYQKVVLHKNGRGITRKVHQLVLETFGNHSRDGNLTRHLDGDKNNNCIDNLRWGTTIENARDAVKHKTSPGLQSYGMNNGQSKLTESDICIIKQMLRNSTHEQQEIALMFGVCKQTITFIKQGKTWKHIGGKHESRTSKSKTG